MMKKSAGLALIVLLPMAAWAQSNNPPASSRAPREIEILGYGLDVHGYLDGAYQSKFIWHGFDLYTDDGVVQGTANVKIADTGFGARVTGNRATGGGNELWQRWDYDLYYQNTVLKGEPIETQFQVGWTYYNFSKWSWRRWDLQEGYARLSMPSVTNIKGLVPSIQVSRLWPSSHENLAGGDGTSGGLYVAMLDYTVSLPGFLPTMPEQVVRVHGEAQFNDGFSPMGTPVDSDWSDAIVGVSTDFDLGYGITLTPAVYYEKIMDMSTSTDGDESETWFAISARLNF
jgi:hypothetical protein